MDSTFETTNLWRRTLAQQPKKHVGPFEPERERLRNAYHSLRKKTAFVVSRIAAAVPQLTQHEISHLDGLWEVADVIIGDAFPVNPLEAYVFGAAVLLHDAALCPEAYDGGLDGLRSTLAWQDAFEFGKSRNSSQTAENAADFATLRALHAKQASLLPSQYWVDPDTGHQLFLIEDEHIRKHLGSLIGHIAASHHWTIEDVQSKLSAQFNSIAEFPREWRIDPIKIACMLRCADAGHINNARAPDFLHALLQRNGISFYHWQAQNWLCRIDVDQSDATRQTILLTSSRDFEASHVDSWWVAYDAARVLDKELRSSNAVLDNTTCGQFQMKTVRGIQSPESMSRHITVRGWQPCSAELHIGNVEKLVRNLGGGKLYGEGLGVDNLQIAIRELVQNSRDAIVARKCFDPYFDGKIVIQIRLDADDATETTWIDVCDNGVGMSRRTLTGPFLDFGSSFWATDLVHEEFPGLRSTSFQSVGEFGIGFYSVFMVSDSVEISTRRFDAGLNDIQRLTFRNGVTLRPLLRSGPCPSFQSWCSTKVSLRVNAKYEDVVRSEKIPSRHNKSHDDIHVPFAEYVASIVAGLDVPVDFIAHDGTSIRVHLEHPLSDISQVKHWLRQISFCEYRPENAMYSDFIDSVAKRLRPIVEDDRVLGFATLNTFLDFPETKSVFSLHTIGGLACNVHDRSGYSFVGFMDCKAQSAKRGASNEFAASETTLKNWAEEQYSLLKNEALGVSELLRIGQSLCDFKVDPIDMAILRVIAVSGVHLLSCYEIARLLSQGDVGIYMMSNWGYGYAEQSTPITPVSGMYLIGPVTNGGEFGCLKLAGNAPVENFSMIDCIHRAAVREGLQPTWTVVQTEALNTYGQPMKMLKCSIERNPPPNEFDFFIIAQ